MNNFFKRLITTIMLGSIITLLFWTTPILFMVLFGFICIYILTIEWPRLNPYINYQGLFHTFVYPTIPLTLFCFFYYTNKLFLWNIIILVATFDTASYIVGKIAGRHRICYISPGKTWEGFLGGIIGVLIICYAIKPDFASSIIFQQIIIIVGCLVAFAGDIYESSLKRKKGLKDSGLLLPGHGGLLDRIDGLLAVIIYASLLYLFF